MTKTTHSSSERSSEGSPESAIMVDYYIHTARDRL